MNGLGFFDLVIGLIFIYLIYSIACSTIWEIMITFSQLRGKMLFKWIFDNFGKDESTLGKKIAEHPLIMGLSRKINRKPSYVSSKTFTDVLLDIVFNEGKQKVSYYDLSTLKKSIEDSKLLNEILKGIFLQYCSEAEGKINLFKEKISMWYDEAQERLAGSYKKNLQIWIFIISLILVGSTNADSIKLFSYLYGNDEARETIALKASLFVQDSSVVRLISVIDATTIDSVSKKSDEQLIKQIGKDFETLKELDKELKKSDIPLGWGNEKLENFWDYVKKICGLLLTSLAVSMGSPFWFDILSKLSNLRAAGNKPKSLLDKNPDQ